MSSDYEKLYEIARRRRSIRRFKPDAVPDEQIEKIIEMARWAMSGANAQPWEFVVVKKPELRERIFELYRMHREQTDVFNRTLLPELKHPVTGTLNAGQRSFRDAPLLIAVCGDPRTYIATSLAAHIIAYERAAFHMNLANATTMIHLAAAALGLGTQWLSTSPIWEGELKKLLGIPEWFSLPQLVPLGYPDYTPGPAYRRECSEILHLDHYDKAKFRTEQQVIDFIIQLRKKMTAAYYIPAKKE
jgi:5,6-dimethylbenzimidazole synthase